MPGNKMQGIRIASHGTPDVMQWVDADICPPDAGQIRVRHEAIGVNYIDIYHRSGLYPQSLPSGLGVEAAGIVESAGEGFAPGDRVVYFAPAPGSYATHRNVEAGWLAKLPDEIDFETAATLWLKACTTEFLVERCARVRPGDAVLVQAAAGGVGQLLCAWLKSVGATVIATVGSPAKTATALSAGADHVLSYAEVPAKVRELTGGKGVSVVFDGVGQDTLLASLDSLAPRGLFVSFGNASGPISDFDFTWLQKKRSLFATRPTLFDYYATPADRALGFKAVLNQISKGVLKAHIGQRFALKDAADAHRAMEARQTIGATLLLP